MILWLAYLEVGGTFFLFSVVSALSVVFVYKMLTLKDWFYRTRVAECLEEKCGLAKVQHAIALVLPFLQVLSLQLGSM
ncbi:hypothetical protein J5N97_005579 [Dioscorea zingiberensis]|uniref:Uncharacterized protein n=1 Tax=Dioscorea zingiberensis TaxID=325984 RepID=A0A9D5D8M6_9LILI|nr:hypothetical protein J5N97_005579 [Dioscorea zingiberensis]